MCGVFGYCGSRPDPDLLREIAERAGTRGPHACGWAYTEAGGALRTVRHLGRVDAHLDEIGALSAPLIVGHARLATIGTVTDTANVQPFVSNGLVIAHNGTIADHWRKASDLALTMETGSDSELLLRLIERQFSDLPAACQSSLSRVGGNAPHALLAARSGRLVAVAYGHPIHVSRRPEGTYVCSRTFTGSVPVSDDERRGMIDAHVVEDGDGSGHNVGIEGRGSGHGLFRPERRRPVRPRSRLRAS